MSKSDIKIFLSYHKDGVVLKSDIMTPIHVGAALNKTILNMQRDDEGINISHKNAKFCELTAQYWVWKNVEADYYGFMHYRRHFAFKDIPWLPDDGGLIHYPAISSDYINEIGLNDDDIRKCVEGSDIIVTPVVDTASWGAPTNEIQFSCLNNLHAVDFDLVCNVVCQLYPEYSEAVEEYRQGHHTYWYNMFIMKKELFYAYCEWLFTIMEEADKHIDYAGYDAAEMRTLAFMAERLFSIYMIKLKKEQPELVIKHLKMSFVHNTDVIEEVKPKNTKVATVNRIDDATYNIEYLTKPIKRAYKELASIHREKEVESILRKELNEAMERIQNKRIYFYGAGQCCRELLMWYKELNWDMPEVIWDRAAVEDDQLYGVSVVSPKFADLAVEGDIVFVITIAHREIAKQVRNQIREYSDCVIIDKREMIRIVGCEYWLRMCGEEK